MLYVVAAGCFFVAAACQATTGFGFALVFVPLLSLFLDLKATVAVSVIAGPVSAIPAVVTLWRHAHRRVVVGLMAGSLAGAPLGAALLVAATPATLRVVVALVIMLSTAVTLAGLSLPEPRRPMPVALAVGAVSGALRSATSMGGPPVALYLLGLRVPPRAFVGTNAGYYVAGSLFSIATLAGAGQVTARVLTIAAVGVPLMLLGSLAGGRLRARASDRIFRAAVVALLFASSLTVLAPVLWGLV